MRKILSSLGILLSLAAGAAEQPWRTTDINQINRLPMHADYDTDSPVLSLEGIWKFQWFENLGEQQADFYQPAVKDDNWADMPVPGMWELNGFGDPIYVNIGYGWRNFYENNPPYVPSERNHVGQYRKTITVPADWKGRDVILTIGSATSNLQVWVNGKKVGYSEDGKLQADFDLSKYLNYGKENLIALEIHRWCDGSYMEDQDYWRFCGIARCALLTARPKTRIQDIRLSADADGELSVTTELKGKPSKVEIVVTDPDGKEHSFSTKDGKLSTSFANAKLWSAEEPTLYGLKAIAYNGNKPTEAISLEFGFRSIEIKNSQVLINGQPVLFKGADRHELSHTGGYVVTEEEMLKDIAIMKQLNINAVRTSHYPNDPRWLRLCNRHGIYVVDEANNESHGMGFKETTLAKNPLYTQTTLERVQRMAQRDINHPSIIFWSLGNESGDGPNFEKAYYWLKQYDNSRPVQYERSVDLNPSYRNGATYISDIYCPMYENYKRLENSVQREQRPIIQCEYAHAMGNSMGGFKEYWDLVRKYPSYQGGFIWDFVDQAIIWPTKAEGTDHIYAFGGDFNDFDPSDNSFNCNGIIAADRTFHPHAYEVQYQYQDIWTEYCGDGLVKISSEKFFIGLDRYAMHWDITCNGTRMLSGTLNTVHVPAQSTEEFPLGFHQEDIDALDGEVFLNVRYVLKRKDGLQNAGDQVAHQQLLLKEGNPGLPAIAARNLPVEYGIDDETGALNSVKVGGREMLCAPLMPCFGRALTENDLGAMWNMRFGAWQYPEFKVESITKTPGRATVIYSMSGLGKVEISYVFAEDGSIAVSEKLFDLAENAPGFMGRVGVEFAMPGTYSNLDFYGFGPYENYSDRNSSAEVGVYHQKVEDQYHYGYVRPQESGTHTGLRWMSVTAEDGSGLLICAPQKFSASALPFARKDIDMFISGGGRLDRADQRHSLELKALAHEGERSKGSTWVNVDLVQMGLGCVDSWYSLPREEYMVPAKEYEFNFVIYPFVL